MSLPPQVPHGFALPLHRSLTEPVLMGGAPRAVAILNGTLAAAVGLGLQLWVAGIVFWIVGHGDPKFLEVIVRHVRQPRVFTC